MRVLQLTSLAIFLLSALILALIFSFTNPADIGPLGVLFVFILLYSAMASTLFIVLFSGAAIARRFGAGQLLPQTRRGRIDHRRAYYIASIGALAPVMLLAMNSMGSLTFQDVALVVVLMALLFFYIIKRT